MLRIITGIIHYRFALVYGMLISVLFAGIESNRKSRKIFAIAGLGLLFLQSLLGMSIGLEMTGKLYPVIVHFPLFLMILLWFKRPWYIALISVLSSYLFCQVPRWIGFLGGSVLESKVAEHIFYMVSIVPLYLFMKRYVIGVLRELIEVSRKNCMLWGGVPIVYYLFDNATTIYTDILYNGEKWVMQFLPVVLSVFYFVSTTLYYNEVQKEAKAQREHDMLETQLKMAKTEFAVLRNLQQNAMAYRHDMRHHFSYLQGLAVSGNVEGIKEYLQNAWSDIENITPIRFCENETLNLLLSSYATKAKQRDIQFVTNIEFSDLSVFSDTEICSLFSNALENAIHACEEIMEREKRKIVLQIYSKHQKICIDLRNRCQKEPLFRNEVPISNRQGHGFGTKSMVHIIEKHEGIYRFSYENGWFIFQVIV